MGAVARNTVGRREVKMTITTDLIEAYLKCPTKCFLLSYRSEQSQHLTQRTGQNDKLWLAVAYCL